MAHGYLGDGYGAHGDIGDNRDEDRDHRWRDRNENASRGDWRDRERNESGWRGDWSDRDRDRNRSMFGGGNDRWSDQGRSSDRDWWEGSGSRGWSDEGRRREGGFGSHDDNRHGRRGFSAHPDDHYRSWRDRHMSDIDRDYEDYCREREQAFHQDFDAWRRQRHADYQPLRTGMTQTGMSHDPSGQVQVATEGEADRSDTDPMADATLGTTSEKSSSGRSRR